MSQGFPPCLGPGLSIHREQSSTHLWVIEFQASILNVLGHDAGTWHVIKSNRAHGWYVNTTSGWVSEPASGLECSTSFQWELASDHPLCQSLQQLLESGGN